jgi:chitinase
LAKFKNAVTTLLLLSLCFTHYGCAQTNTGTPPPENTPAVSAGTEDTAPAGNNDGGLASGGTPASDNSTEAQTAPDNPVTEEDASAAGEPAPTEAQPAPDNPVAGEDASAAGEPAPTDTPYPPSDPGPKDLCVYYMNWSVYSDQRQQVRDLPFDRVSTVNHAFWQIKPSDDMKSFPIVSNDPAADLSPGGCFDQYAEMTAQYPDVTVALSIGGWGALWFPEMSYTPEGRKSFIDSCIETLRQYPFLGGIDLDWEYPTSPYKNNFTALVRELRLALDEADMRDVVVTFCSQAGTNASSGIDFAAIHPYIHRVNIMTYDMSGSWTGKTMHHSSLYPGKNSAPQSSASESAAHLIRLGVPPGKINIGSPLYSHGWVVEAAESGADALGKPTRTDAYGTIGAGQLHWHQLRQLENTEGWEKGYDEEAGGAYLYCTDPASDLYQNFYSYESDVSLGAKLEHIRTEGLGGLIVWSTAGDRVDADYPMLTQMAEGLDLYEGTVPTYNALPWNGTFSE